MVFWGPINRIPKAARISFRLRDNGSMDLGEFSLSEAQFERLRPLLPNKVRGSPGSMTPGDQWDHACGEVRRALGRCAVLLRAQEDALQSCPEPVEGRFVRWAAKGVWRDLFVTLAAAGGPPPEVLIDGTHMKALRSAGGGKGARFIKPSGSAGAAALGGGI